MTEVATNETAQSSESASALADLQLSDAEIFALPAKVAWSLAGRLRAASAYDDAARVLDLLERKSGETLQLLEERAPPRLCSRRHRPCTHSPATTR